MLALVLALAVAAPPTTKPATTKPPATTATTKAPATTPATTAPATTTPATPETTTPAPKADQLAPAERWGTLETMGAQLGAGTAAAVLTGVCVGIPANFIPFGSIVANGVAGLMIGGTEVVVGDALGPDRAALLWPMVTSSAILVVGGTASVGAALYTRAPLSIDPSNPGVYLTSPQARLPLFIQGVSVAAAVVVPVVVYQIVSVPKEAGDGGGFGMPGMTVPADPTGTRLPELAPIEPTTAMRF